MQQVSERFFICLSTIRIEAGNRRLPNCLTTTFLSFFSGRFRFYNCVNGVAYELPCATTLIFDEAQGTCVREDQASQYAKKCEKKLEKGNNSKYFFTTLI